MRIRHIGDASMLTQSNGRSIIRNGILRSLSFSDLSYICSLLRPFALNERAVLQEPNRRVDYVNFVETGIVSLRTLEADSILETAIVGCHGAVGVSIALCGEVSMHRSIVLVPGIALRIRADDLQRTIIERPLIRECLLRYVQSLMTHSSQIALCGVRHELEQRLACWLCLICDSLDGDAIPVTHDHISLILGLRRSGITEALVKFEEQGLVQKTRGVLQVRDRSLLQRRACGCYQTIANAYAWTKAPGLTTLKRAENTAPLRSDL